MTNRWSQLHEEIEAHTQHLATLTQAAAPTLGETFGIGTDTAAQMLITFGENAERVHSEAAFALDEWGLSDSSLVGQNAAPPLKPRRQPLLQCCFVSRRHGANAVA
ncbi:MAG: hypothetical protein CLLPBCKN_001522 [Chroococcidiopsis cubana SAG 39.79]|uniref:Uncharacterized protein n=2 Tax=Chroococcidiopsis TaxID=54298 RepID=A0AB37U9Q1_9CYAN|nr:hypothetical protein [Chroococcidiopsis cubana SAG 39.79]RUT00725.1 hypothetical protein DSM107010_66990 [Chroococcidiopsis cubana SAG 39.79]